MRKLKYYLLIVITMIQILGACEPQNTIYGSGVIVASLYDKDGEQQLLFNDMATNKYYTIALPRPIRGFSISGSGQIIYTSMSTLYLFDINGGESKLTSLAGDLGTPIWSKNGDYIAFAAVQDKVNTYLYDAQHGTTIKISTNPDYSESPVGWLDNYHILLISGIATPDVEVGTDWLTTIRNDGTERKALYQWASNQFVTQISLSPDGKTLLLGIEDKSESGTSLFELFSISDFAEKLLANIPSDSTSFAWSPNGASFAYIHDQGIYIYDLNTGDINKLPVPNNNYNDLVWGQTVN